MNDSQIRRNFHRKRLRRQHVDESTLVVDELGLNHGRCRADIVVVNGHLAGYEIKSDSDSLRRLTEQVKSYNAIFDRAFIVVGERYVKSIRDYIPEWWGVILSVQGPRGGIEFNTLRKSERNGMVDPISVARLLWRDEVVEVLKYKDFSPKQLRQPRAVLYEYLVSVLSICELKKTVREHLKLRKDWRCPGSPL